MTSWITICAGCKRADWGERGMDKTDGEAFAELIEAAAQHAGINTRRVSCTMGCERACNVIVQAAGKISYSLGMFDATPSDAQAIVDYAVMHSESETGQVPFRQWPIGVKGHFVSRHIPLPEQN
jgi:predicted metal-binding protein